MVQETPPSRALTFTPELLLTQLAQLLALVFGRLLATGLARLDGIQLEVVGQPAQVAIASERIFTQMTLIAANRIVSVDRLARGPNEVSRGGQVVGGVLGPIIAEVVGGH